MQALAVEDWGECIRLGGGGAQGERRGRGGGAGGGWGEGGGRRGTINTPLHVLDVVEGSRLRVVGRDGDDLRACSSRMRAPLPRPPRPATGRQMARPQSSGGSAREAPPSDQSAEAADGNSRAPAGSGVIFGFLSSLPSSTWRWSAPVQQELQRRRLRSAGMGVGGVGGGGGRRAFQSSSPSSIMA